jgi:hypothetical protein
MKDLFFKFGTAEGELQIWARAVGATELATMETASRGAEEWWDAAARLQPQKRFRRTNCQLCTATQEGGER